MKMTAKEIFEKFQGAEVIYKCDSEGTIAGYHGNYLVIGYDDCSGAITSFNINKVTLVNYFDKFRTFRIAKPEYCSFPKELF